MNTNHKNSDLSPRWGTWFIEWLTCEYHEHYGEPWEVWHKEMLLDHEWYLDFWKTDQDWFRSASYYADWQESSKLVQILTLFYYVVGRAFWQLRLAHFNIKAKLGKIFCTTKKQSDVYNF